MSKYKDFFIDWNAFWAGCGEMMPGGYIQPTPEYLHKMFFRKPGLPILMVRMPDGTEKPYWNTFYQQVDYPCPDARELVAALGMQYQSACALAESLQTQLEAGKRPAELELGRWELLRSKLTDLLESRRRYLGQMDLNVASPLVWEFYSDTLHTLAGYGACIVRLDAFAYAHKAVGEHNFLNEPGTWDILARLQMLADADGVNAASIVAAINNGGSSVTLSADKIDLNGITTVADTLHIGSENSLERKYLIFHKSGAVISATRGDVPELKLSAGKIDLCGTLYHNGQPLDL